MPSSLMRTRGHKVPEHSDDFDCTLCLKLLYEPITTPCGHSFCRSCLFQTMDRSEYLQLLIPILVVLIITTQLSDFVLK